MALTRLLTRLRLTLLVLAISALSAVAVAGPQSGEGATGDGASGEVATESAAQEAPTSPAALADMLADEQTRNQLIDQLRAAARGEPSGEGQSGEGQTGGDMASSVGGRVASFTQGFAQDLGQTLSDAVAAFRAAGSGEGVGLPWHQWSEILVAFAIAAVSTVAAFLLLRALIAPIYRRIDQWVGRQPPAMPEPDHEATEADRVLMERRAERGAGDEEESDDEDERSRDGAVGTPTGRSSSTSANASSGAETAGETLSEEEQAHAREEEEARARAEREVQEARDRQRKAVAARSLFKRCAAVVGALAIDVVLIFLAGAAGYLVSLFFSGEAGEMGRTESLFINAFVMVETVKALVRMVFSTRYSSLRLFAMPDEDAAYWNHWLAIIVGAIGYGLLVAVPLVNAILSPAVGQLLSLVIMVLVYIYAVRGITSHRQHLREALERRADQTGFAFFGTLLRMLGRIWHLLAIAYFTVLLVVSQVEPTQALPFMARATLQTLLAVGVGVLISSLLSIALSRRIRLSPNLSERLPMLEKRINSYVPLALKGLRTILTIFVVLAVFDAWRAFDLPGWLASESGARTIGMIVHVAIILAIATFIWTVVASFIEHRLSAASEPSAREKTLLSLFRNAILVLIVTMTILVVLSQIGINIGPLIAGAGVVGLAIGFGAQKLVQDIITGVFIQLENAMNTGDVVGVAGLTGTAEKITIRSVGLRTLDGTFHVIPFSSVDTVSNYMRDFAYHVGEYGIAYREDVDNAIHHLHQAFAELTSDPEMAESVLEEMAVPGVIALADSSINIRIMIKTKPGSQWAVGRQYNQLVKKHFDAAGIEIPFPHTTLYFGQDKDGGSPPANIHLIDEYVVEEGQASAAGQPSHSRRSGKEKQRSSKQEQRRLKENEKLPDEDNDDAPDDGGDMPR